MEPERSRPFFEPGELAAFAARILGNRTTLLRAVHGREKVSPRLREIVMLAVTEINQCRWCREAHTILGRFAGLKEEELRRLKVGNSRGFSKEEKALVRFGQRFAHAGGNLDCEEAHAILGAHFPEAEIAAFQSIAQVIHTANLLGNTFDRFVLGRLLRRAAPEDGRGSWHGEFLVSMLFLQAWPVALPFFSLVSLMNALGFREPFQPVKE
jgi:AhpD family alkylhydroperoxidase